jgi:hypothetical protein
MKRLILIVALLTLPALAGPAVQLQADGWEQPYWIYETAKLDNGSLIFYVDEYDIKRLDPSPGVMFEIWR